MNHKDLWNRITSNGMREMTEDRFYQALKEIDLPESKEIDNNGDWLSPIQSEREHQEKQLKELWPDYPNGCPKWQTLNGLLFYTNKFMELDEKFDGWIPVTQRLPEVGERVLCDTQFGVQIGFRRLDGLWSLSNGAVVDVKLWQPLPAVPQEKGKP